MLQNLNALLSSEGILSTAKEFIVLLFDILPSRCESLPLPLTRIVLSVLVHSIHSFGSNTNVRAAHKKSFDLATLTQLNFTQ